MVTLHPNILKKNGKEEFVVISFEEFLLLQQELEDYELLKKLREAKLQESNAKTVSLLKVKEQLGVN